jgi:hypothetical protein
MYDVENGVYPGWCLDYHTPLPFDDFVEPDVMPIPVMLYSSYCPPDELISDGWDEVNYILNHKHPDAGWSDIHKAINQFVVFGDTVPAPPEGSIGDQMVDEAMSKDPDWIPGCGDVVAVIVDPLEDQIPIEMPIEDQWGTHYRWQYTIIEVPVPCEYEGLTPGFWKNKGVKVGWPSPYIPKDSSATTLEEAGFIIPNGGVMDDNPRRPVYKEDTLLDALNYKGGEDDSGMAQNLLRAAVAALLNAAHPEVNYPLSVAEVISQVNAALASGREDMEILKNELDMNNNLGADEWW